jgi:hypothetical protein
MGKAFDQPFHIILRFEVAGYVVYCDQDFVILDNILWQNVLIIIIVIIIIHM